ncbi:porin family protein [Vibrio harveyi]|uniref:porin family protein n=1 Tax=Vibrio harveyi TaxID=669 RepID=UPI00237F234A|nr:porin family protein [Vibrio harveyi]HDM8068682.1 porin family protein [Vibrio harveyi]
MKLKVIALTVLSVLSASAFADTKEINDGYVGLEIGQQSSSLAEDINKACYGDCLDDDTFVFGALIGYNFNKYVALEGSFQTASYDYEIGGSADVQTFSLGPKFQYPLSNNIAFFVKPGIAYTTQDTGLTKDEDELGFMVAGGVEIELTSYAAIRATYEYT